MIKVSGKEKQKEKIKGCNLKKPNLKKRENRKVWYRRGGKGNIIKNKRINNKVWKERTFWKMWE